MNTVDNAPAVKSRVNFVLFGKNRVTIFFGGFYNNYILASTFLF